MVAEDKWQYKNEHLIIRPVEHFCIKHAVSENSTTRVPKVQIMQGQTHLMQISPLLFVRPLEPTVKFALMYAEGTLSQISTPCAYDIQISPWTNTPCSSMN